MPEPFHILIVDDDALDRRATRRALQGGPDPVEIEEAENVTAALDALTGRRFDCALLDYQLPDGDGLALLRRVRAAGILTPLIMLTGHGDELIAVELMKAGASDYLSKNSLSSDSLWAGIRGAMRLREAQRQAGEAEQQRDEAEAELRQALQQLRFHIDNSPLAVIEWDSDFHVARWSGQAERIFGWTAAETVGKSPGDWPFVHPDDVSAVQEVSRRLIDGQEQGNVSSNRNCRKDGAVLYCTWYNSALRDPDGSLLSVLSLVQDRTEQRRAEDSLRESEERYRSLVVATSQIEWRNSADGYLREPLPGWQAFTGQTFEQMQGYGWLDAVHPDDREHAAQVWAEAVRTRALYQVEYRVRGRDGRYREFLVRGVPLFAADGSVREWVGTCDDITERKAAERRLLFLSEASTALGASLDYERTLQTVAQMAVPQMADWCAVDLAGEGGVIRRVETAHSDPEKRAVALEMAARFPTPPQDQGIAQVVRSGVSQMVSPITEEMIWNAPLDPEYRRYLMALGLRSYLAVPLTARGRTFGAITFVRAESGADYTQDDLRLAEELARRAALAVDNSRLLAEAQARARQEALVNAVGRALRRTLVEEEILEIVAAEVGRALEASRCLWQWFSPDRARVRVAPQQYLAPGVAPLRGEVIIDQVRPAVMAQLSQGSTVAVADVSQEDIRAPLSGDLKSFVACPVFLRGDWEAIFVVNQTDAPRVWTAEQVDLVSAIVDIAALALENARLYGREHRVADMLQSAFLPEIPRELGDLAIDRSYRAGLAESHVGGDFYDAFALADGRVALVMADVSGKGLNAAVQTATVKYSLRAFATEAAAPDLVLTRLNRTLSNDSSGLGDHFVTLFYGVYDPKSGRLSYASAGHETQLIKRAAGGAERLEATGPILGIAEHLYEQTAILLEAGDSLILFTDGLTEARNPQSRAMLDIDRIQEAVAGYSSHWPPASVCRHLTRLALDWSEGQPQDDLALLVARRRPPSGRSAPATQTQAEPADESVFRMSLPSVPDYAAEVRQAVSHWMSVLGYSQEASEDFQTAITEAVTNAVRHGSPNGAADRFDVSARWQAEGGGALSVEVADRGPGLPPPLTPVPMPEPDAPGGRGLPLMRLFSDALDYPPAARGHRVRLTKRRRSGP